MMAWVVHARKHLSSKNESNSSSYHSNVLNPWWDASRDCHVCHTLDC